MNISYVPKKIKQFTYNGYLFESIESLEQELCTPLIFPNIQNTSDNESLNHNIDFINSNPSGTINDFVPLLANEKWVKEDIETILYELNLKSPTNEYDSNLGNAFSHKYGMLSREDDARSVSIEWFSDFKRALNHLNPKSLKGNLLHIGSDTFYEPHLLHESAKEVFLVDIASKLLLNAELHSPNSRSYITRAEKLYGIPNNSINLFVALRVFDSIFFNKRTAIIQSRRVLQEGGSILLSVSNGYKAIDNTVLPGQIAGKSPYLDLSLPFDTTLEIVSLLHEFGFKELFIVPGATELFIGGTLQSNFKYDEPVLHIDSINSVSIYFYSELMPTSWLTNFSNHSIIVNGETWPTVEHYFQSEKFNNILYKRIIKEIATPLEAKSFAWSKHSEIRNDWDSYRLKIMRIGLKAKFDQYPFLNQALLSTKNRELIERSALDAFWGQSLSGEGINMMGNLLMELREYYKYQ